jgi:hypothetical protein
MPITEARKRLLLVSSLAALTIGLGAAAIVLLNRGGTSQTATWEPAERSREVETMEEAEQLAGFEARLPDFIPDGFERQHISALRVKAPNTDEYVSYVISVVWQQDGVMGFILLYQSKGPDDLDATYANTPEGYHGTWLEVNGHRALLTPDSSLRWNSTDGHGLMLSNAGTLISDDTLLRIAESIPTR